MRSEVQTEICGGRALSAPAIPDLDADGIPLTLGQLESETDKDLTRSVEAPSGHVHAQDEEAADGAHVGVVPSDELAPSALVSAVSTGQSTSHS